MPSRYGLIGSPKSKPGSPTVGQSLEDLRCMFSWSPSSPRWRLWIVFLTCLSIVGCSSPGMWLTLTTTSSGTSTIVPAGRLIDSDVAPP
uniref:Uncharacterized protein n=1 Tax=Knipowitschia caucasica TaxID=637954 RepID=A0AAV2J312_KNICA